jgi:hypothetical protein
VGFIFKTFLNHCFRNKPLFKMCEMFIEFLFKMIYYDSFLQNISSKISVMPTLVEEKETTDKDISSHLGHVESCSQNLGRHETDQGMPLPDALERFSDTNLRYKWIGLCAFKEKECKVLFADYVEISELSSRSVYRVVLQALRSFMGDGERGLSLS